MFNPNWPSDLASKRDWQVKGWFAVFSTIMRPLPGKMLQPLMKVDMTTVRRYAIQAITPLMALVLWLFLYKYFWMDIAPSKCLSLKEKVISRNSHDKPSSSSKRTTSTLERYCSISLVFGQCVVEAKRQKHMHTTKTYIDTYIHTCIHACAAQLIRDALSRVDSQLEPTKPKKSQSNSKEQTPWIWALSRGALWQAYPWHMKSSFSMPMLDHKLACPLG